MDKIFAGFTDVTEAMAGGVYVLLLRGRPVFVGTASKEMLAKISVHRTNARQTIPSWFPVQGVVFDQVLVRRVHPDQLSAVYTDLCETLGFPHAQKARTKVSADC